MLCVQQTPHIRRTELAVEGVIIASGLQVMLWENERLGTVQGLQKALGMCQMHQLEARTSKM